MSEIIASSTRDFRNNPVQKVLKVDMTPMVDLGFLLITFFIFTTSLIDQKTTSLILPADGTPMNLPATTALTALLGANNRVIVYSGELKSAITTNRIITTTYSTTSGLGAVIRQQQKKLLTMGKRDDLMILIKPLDDASYQNFINALDEIQINNVKHYAVVSPDKEELQYVIAQNL